MRKILITGSEGFVGQHLWKELVENGYEVYGTALHTPETGLPQNVFICDIESQEQLSSLIKKIMPDAIVHLAAWSNPGSSFDSPQKTFEINTIGTINLLEAIRAQKNYRPRILIIGSSAEFGIVPPTKLPITEETPLSANSPYGVSKISNWFVARQYVISYGFDIIYPTPFNHTGPGQGLGFLSTDITSQIVKMEKGEQDPILKVGDLTPLRDMLDVRDVVRAYRLLMEKGRTGERYVICTGKSIPVADVVNKLISFSSMKITKVTDPNKLRPSDMPEQRGNPQKIFDETGWRPEISLDKTLQDLLDWYRQK